MFMCQLNDAHVESGGRGSVRAAGRVDLTGFTTARTEPRPPRFRPLRLILSVALTVLYMTCGSALAQAPAPTPAENVQATDNTKPTVILAVGAPGEEAYGKLFAEWAARWQAAAKRGGAAFVVINDPSNTAEPKSDDADHVQLKAALDDLPRKGHAPVWIVLIGHGTFDGQRAMFNLRGKDVSAEELNAWLKPVERPVAVINCASASAPFLVKLAKSNRVVVTATRSGYELNFARFGEYLSQAVADEQNTADLDKDGQVSLLEAYLSASRATTEFYEADGRLVTEHALLDDNGDGKGTSADFFRGIRATKRAADGASLDGLRAHQFHLVPSERERRMPPAVRAQRDDLELRIATLRDRKSELGEDAYYAALEPLLLELARLYASLDAKGDSGVTRGLGEVGWAKARRGPPLGIRTKPRLKYTIGAWIGGPRKALAHPTANRSLAASIDNATH